MPQLVGNVGLSRAWVAVGVVALTALAACGDDAEPGNGDRDLDGGGSEDGEMSAVAEVQAVRLPVGELTFDGIAAGPEDGEVVLLLHGFPQTSHTFRDQVIALGTAGYRAVAPDQRGYSPDARPPEVEDYRIPDLVGDVIGMANALDAETFHLVGHDWGGMVAWQVAGRHPDRLDSLTVLSTPHPVAFVRALGDPASEQGQMSGYIDLLVPVGSEEQLLADDAGLLRGIFMASGLPDGLEDTYVEALGTPEALGSAINWYRAVDGTMLDGLGPITVPTMYVWSTEDVALGRSAAEATADHVDGDYRFEVLEGISHWVSEEVPDDVSELLLDHIVSSG